MKKITLTLFLVIFLTNGLVFAESTTGAHSEKTTYRYDIKRSGYSSLSIAPPFVLKWFYNTNPKKEFIFSPKISYSLVGEGNILYLGTLGNNFLAFDTVKKEYLWQYETYGIVQAGATIEGDRIFFGDSKGYFYCLNKNTGAIFWQNKYANEILSSPLVVADKIYFTDMDDSLYCISVDNGIIKWKVEIENYLSNIVMRGSTSPSYNNGYIYQGFSDGYLYCFDANTSKEIFRKKVKENGKFTDVDAPPAIDGDVVYSSSFDGNFMAVKLTAPETKWQIKIKGNGYPSYNKDSLIVSSTDGVLYKVDKEIGNIIWEKELSFDLTPPIVTDKYVFVASNDYFYVLDINSGEILYKYEPGSGISSELCLIDDNLYFMSNKGYLYCFKSKQL